MPPACENAAAQAWFSAKLTDGEVITMEIVGEFIAKDQDKSVWQYFHNPWHSGFPHLGSRSN
ncbi:MAG: hypothetical protein PHG00_06455 [Methylococcales bacterium]|nr:hypothetical protein [Methylococcales bacterium]